jgi:hypothetical protein
MTDVKKQQADRHLQIQIGMELKTISSWAGRRAAVNDKASLGLLREYLEIILDVSVAANDRGSFLGGTLHTDQRGASVSNKCVSKTCCDYWVF